MWHDLPHYQPIEQVPDRRQALFHRRCGQRLCLQLDPGGDVQRGHREQIRHACGLAPAQELVHRPRIGPPRVRIANLGGEKF
ncbi:hypothetical protein D3C71_1337650 [compost metagenome]